MCGGGLMRASALTSPSRSTECLAPAQVVALGITPPPTSMPIDDMLAVNASDGMWLYVLFTGEDTLYPKPSSDSEHARNL